MTYQRGTDLANCPGYCAWLKGVSGEPYCAINNTASQSDTCPREQAEKPAEYGQTDAINDLLAAVEAVNQKVASLYLYLPYEATTHPSVLLGIIRDANESFSAARRRLAGWKERTNG